MELTQRSFTAGEVSPSVSSRAELEWYSSALSHCENAYVRAQGGVYNREGLKYLGEIGNTDGSQFRLIPFEINSGENYILALSPLKMRVIDKDGFVKNPDGTRFIIATPFTDPWAVTYSPFVNIVTMCDGISLPQTLRKFNDGTWELKPISFGNSQAKPKSVSITADGLGNKNYKYAVTAIGKNGIESGAVFKNSGKLMALSSTRAATIHVTGADGDNTIEKYNFYKSIDTHTANIERSTYGYIGSAHNKPDNTSQFSDLNYGPDVSLSVSVDNDPFKEEEDRPKVCGMYQQRRIFASTKNNPQTVFCTEIGDISSMRYSEPGRPTDSITQEIVSDKVNGIRHIINMNGLMLLTENNELTVSEGSDFVLTPSSFGVKTSSNYGASRVTPTYTGTSVIFSQEQGARLISLDSGTDSLLTGGGSVISNDLSIRAEHIFEGRKIVDMTYDKEPYSIIWCVLDNGHLIGLTYNKAHKVWGFHRHTTQGKFLSVSSVTRGNRTATYVIVERIRGGQKKHFVEIMQERLDDNPADAFFVDSGLTKTVTTPSKEFSGFRHLEGMAVAVLADGNEVKGITVSGGTITLPVAAKKVHVGLGYKTKIITLPIDNAKYTMRGKEKVINSIILDLINTRDVSAGQVGTPLSILKTPKNEKDFDLKTGEYTMSAGRGWKHLGKIQVEHDSPLPFALLSITPRFDVE